MHVYMCACVCKTLYALNRCYLQFWSQNGFSVFLKKYWLPALFLHVTSTPSLIYSVLHLCIISHNCSIQRWMKKILNEGMLITTWSPGWNQIPFVWHCDRMKHHIWPPPPPTGVWQFQESYSLIADGQSLQPGALPFY